MRSPHTFLLDQPPYQTGYLRCNYDVLVVTISRLVDLMIVIIFITSVYNHLGDDIRSVVRFIIYPQ